MISASLATDTGATKYVYRNLSVYSLKKALMNYDYFRVEDSRSLTAVSRRGNTALSSAIAGPSSVLDVGSTAGFEEGDSVLAEIGALHTNIGTIAAGAVLIGSRTSLPSPADAPLMTNMTPVYSLYIGASDLTKEEGQVREVLQQGVVEFMLGSA